MEAIVAQLEDRQGCERRRERNALDSHCTEEWEHADLFTFDVADAPTVVPPGRGNGPPLPVPASDDLSDTLYRTFFYPVPASDDPKAAPGATR